MRKRKTDVQIQEIEGNMEKKIKQELNLNEIIQ
jgi:hypothetical protein